MDRKAKQKCAVLIQKHVRGHQQRKEYVVMKANLGYIKKFRKTADKMLNKVKTEMLSSVLYVLRQSHEKVKTEQEILMNDFLNLCATSI